MESIERIQIVRDTLDMVLELLGEEKPILKKKIKKAKKNE